MIIEYFEKTSASEFVSYINDCVYVKIFNTLIIIIIFIYKLNAYTVYNICSVSIFGLIRHICIK